MYSSTVSTSSGGRRTSTRSLDGSEKIVCATDGAADSADDGADKERPKGMGEPLANYSAVIGAVRRLVSPAPDGLGMSARGVTVSTVGLVPRMQQLAGEEPTEPKHFMTSYMIAAFPTHVFDTIGPVENELTTAAREFITQLESIAGDARNGNPVDAQAIEGFRATAADFHAKFNTWRVADRERLTVVLATQVVALITAKIALPADAPEHAQVDHGIALIKNKLRAIGSNPEVLRAALAVAFPGFPGFANV